MIFKHVLFKTGDDDAPSAITDSNGDVVLALCRNCHRGEVELDEHPECDLRAVDWDKLNEERKP